MTEKELKKLQEKAQEAERERTNHERELEKIEKEYARIKNEIKQANDRKSGEVSNDLKMLEDKLRQRERVIANNEENYSMRIGNLEKNELNLLRAEEKEKMVRQKAIIVETRRMDAEKLWSQAMDKDSEGKTKLAEAG